MIKKLAIITTHPIQYYAPVFKMLAKECELKVFYTWGVEAEKGKLDPQFKQLIIWDIPLLEGYTYSFVPNTAKNKGSHHFKGIVNPTLIAEINAFAPDALLVYGWAYQSHLKVLRFFKGKIPVWFRGDSTLLDHQNILKATIRKVFLKWVYTYIDKAFYVGQANKAYFKNIGLKDNQLIFAPHAIDNERFAADRGTEADQIRNSFNIKKDDILILFAGKFEHKKDPSILISVFKEINQPNIHLLFVGSGELDHHLKEQSKGAPNVHFLAFQNQSQMPATYQACDLFCLPSAGPGETWGLAVNEAMAAKKAVLISDKVGCAADLVIPNINGQIFKAKDTVDLQLKLKQLVKSKEVLLKMGLKSAEIIKDFSFHQQAIQIIGTLYQ